MGVVDVIIPTLDRPHANICANCLESFPFDNNVLWIRDGKSWPEAINHGLKLRRPNRDVVLMDDDVYILPNTFQGLDKVYEKADIFGFKLLFPDGRIQHAGGVFSDLNGGMVGHRFFMENDKGQADAPAYVAHVTTSLIYIKSHVIEKLVGMATDYPGMQMEDVDFCLRAIKAGFKILYLPGPAIHLESGTKKNLPKFRIGMTMNMLELKKRFFAEESFLRDIALYPKFYEG